MDGRKNGGLLKKTKPIALSPCSDNGNMMWTLEENAEVQSPDLQVQPGLQNTSPRTGLGEVHISKLVTSSSSGGEKKDKSPLEATFTHPKDVLDSGVESKGKVGKKGSEYRALEFVSTSSQANSLTLSVNGEEVELNAERVLEEEWVGTALLTFALSLASPLFSLAMAYWHWTQRDLTPALISAIICPVAAALILLAFLSAPSSPKKKIWKTSKIVTLLCFIPGLTSIILSFCNVIFALKECKCRSYERPWSNTKYLFLVESLSYAFPQTVLLILLLAEDPILINSIKGYVCILGLVLFSFAITFARFRYDSQNRYERFGTGLEKYIRFTYIWANKGLWFVTYGLVIRSLRLLLPLQKTTTTIVGVALLLALLEAPILLSMTRPCARIAQSMLGLFMMIPQFVALGALIVWVNVDPTVYVSDNGSFVLGLFFYAEMITLTGWLYDRCTGRDIDFIPVYPHFFADLLTTNSQ